MVVAETGLSIGVPVLVGLVLAILEAYFVYEDENMVNGKALIADLWHGLIFCVGGTLIACNAPYVITYLPLGGFERFLFINDQGISLTICILITIVMKFKMVASHAIKGVSSNGFTEKFWHKILVAGLVGFSPYYVFPLAGTIAQYVPSWLPL